MEDLIRKISVRDMLHLIDKNFMPILVSIFPLTVLLIFYFDFDLFFLSDKRNNI